MASTTLSNVNFLSQPFLDTMAATFTHKLAFLTSGVLMDAGGIIPDTIGYTVAIPKWDTLTGDAEQITSSSTTTVNNITDIKDVGVYVEREKAWGADAIIRTVAGKDATQAIASQIAEYWAGELQRDFVNRVTGVFTTALASTHSTSTTYSSSTINMDAVLGAKQLLGDNQDLLTDIIMHSKVRQDAIKEKITNYDNAQADSFVTGMIERILGMRTHVTDKLTAVSSVYSSYLAVQGAGIFKFRQRQSAGFTNANLFNINAGGLKIEIELNRESKTAGGQDELITRASYFTHVPGVAWGSATTNPTDAQLATGSNWTKVQSDNKLIRIVQLKTL